MKDDNLNIQEIPVNPIAFQLIIVTIEGHVKYHKQKNAIISNTFK